MTEKQAAIVVNDLSKTFRLPHEQYSGAKNLFVNLFRTRRGYEQQEVLNNISFTVNKGDFFGIVGRNGSGKSTLLKLIANIYVPDSGAVAINGSLTPFIELGVGFNPELTGRENVYLNGALLGFSRKEVDGLYSDIVEFAELEKFMDQKLKNYSSGMQVRLAFSIAIRSKSDILLIDEVLAVGDAAFQVKCFDYFYSLKKSGTTVVLVSHDRGSLERFCDRGILLDEGKLVATGTISEVLNSYSQIVLDRIDGGSTALAPKEEEKTEMTNRQSGYAKILEVKTLDQDGQSKRVFRAKEKILVSYRIKIKKPVEGLVSGITIWEKNLSRALFSTDTLIEQDYSLSQLAPGDEATLTIGLPTNLNDAEYYVEPAIANGSGDIFYDQKPKAISFVISGSRNAHSLLTAEDGIKIAITKDKDV